MACIFMDGFDWYQQTDLLKRWTGSRAEMYAAPTTALYISPLFARQPTGQGLLLNANNLGGPNICIYKQFSISPASGCIGFAMNFGSAGRTSQTLMVVLDTPSTEQISVRTNGSGVPIVSRNGTTLATGTTVLAANTWYYIELKFTINNSTGVIELHLNGATEIASTGSLNTRNSSNNYWNAFAFGNLGNVVVDDVYALDTTTGTNTTFLGPVRVEAVYPTAPGNYAQWSPNGGTNYGCVSESWEDGDATFNQSSTANQIDSFVMDDLAVSSGSVFAVQNIVTARQDSGAARTLAPMFRIGGTDYVGTAQGLSTSYQMLSQIYDQSPATSSAWTPSEVAGTEAGYKLVS